MLVHLAILITVLSLLAFGGANAIVPELHRQVVDVMGAMTDADFTNLFALAQTAPGPNVMILSLVGWRLAGAAGLAVATAKASPSQWFGVGIAFRSFGAVNKRTGKSHAGRTRTEPARYVSQLCAQKQGSSHHLSRQWREAARSRHLVRQFLCALATRRPFATRL